MKQCNSIIVHPVLITISSYLSHFKYRIPTYLWKVRISLSNTNLQHFSSGFNKYIDTNFKHCFPRNSMNNFQYLLRNSRKSSIKLLCLALEHVLTMLNLSATDWTPPGYNWYKYTCSDLGATQNLRES